MLRDRNNATALHYACESSNPLAFEIVKMLIDVGGRELVMMESRHRGTALHLACKSSNPSAVEIVKMLIGVGGMDLVMLRKVRNQTALDWSCQFVKPSAFDIVKTLIDVDGRELVLDVGERELFMIRSRYNSNALHWACSSPKPSSVNIVRVLIEKGVEINIGGEFGIGGLFNNSLLEDIGSEFGIGGLFNSSSQPYLYERWNKKIAPALSHESMQVVLANKPILHAAIIGKAPINIIQDIINIFPNSIYVQDSKKRSPLDVAMEEGLQWGDGLNIIVEATATQQECTMLDVAAKIGLPWDKVTQHTVKDENVDNVGHRDDNTDFYPFMTAAVNDNEIGMKECDLESIFSLMKMRPDLVRHYDIQCSNDHAGVYLKEVIM
jgi:hypothetical protein